MFLKPALVAHITLSKIINIDGSINTTTNILMIAPRAISVQSEAIISTLAIIPTPNVAANNPCALTIIDGIVVPSAFYIASFLELPAALSLLYLVVIRIA